MLSKTVMVLAVVLVLHHPVYAQPLGSACLNPRGEYGVCQELRTCEPIMQLLRLHGTKVTQFLQQSMCGYNSSDRHVCCANTIRNNINHKIKPVSWTSSYGPLLPPDCGTTHFTYTRIVNGVPAQLGQWPWIVALGYRGKQNPKKPRWLCGGSLISARHVLTAAHCIYKHDELYVVRIGDLDLEDEYDGAMPIDSSIDRRTIHPRYNPRYRTNDVGVLRLQFDIPFTPLIRPICLPITDSIRQKHLEGAFPFIVGWGSTSYNGPRSPQLQQIQVPIVSQNWCQYAYGKFRHATIDGRVFCAGYARGGKDACTGDSGGPLMYPIGTTFYAIGVVSYGYKCAEPGYPGVFSNTTEFLDFIIPQLN